METSGDTCMNAMCMEVLIDYRGTVDSNRETAETVETTGDTCKYKIVWRVRETLKETKETIETMQTSNMQIQNCMERQRLEETEGTRKTMETSGDT